MPWPTQTTTQDNTLERVDQTAARLKANSAAFRLQAEAGTVKADKITEEVLRNLVVARDTFNAAAAVPGIAAFVAAQRGVTAQQVTAAFNDMLSAVNAAISWISSNMPKDANGWLLVRTMAADGAMTYRDFTPAQTLGLRNALQAVEATIA